MEKIVPHDDPFNKALQSYKNYKRLVYVAAGLSFCSGAISYIPTGSSILTNCFSVIAFVITVLILVSKLNFHRSYREAEKIRRNDYWDNSFGTRMSDTPSRGYYDTDDIQLGFKKLLANLHENSLFSSRIAKKMIEKSEKISILFIVVILGIALLNFLGTQLIITVADIFLSFSILEDLWQLKYFYKEVENVQETCRKIWDNISDAGDIDQKNIAYIMRAYTQYETSLSYASTLLDSKIYAELNGPLTNEFEQLKIRYKMI